MIYESPPVNFKPKFETAACFLEANDMFLMLKRQQGKRFENTWCLPGGKKEEGETLETCARREVFEETGFLLDGIPVILAKTVYVKNSDLHYVYHMFKVPMVAQLTPTLNMAEHSHYIWASAKQALTMQLIPGQAECIQLLYRDRL